MAKKIFLAVDIGASGGRVLAGLLANERLELDEVYRFPNGPVRVGKRLHWDLLGQWLQIQNGLRAAAVKYGSEIVSLGVDTWGVDFGLLGKDNELLGNPYAYRDGRTAGIFDRAFEIVPKQEIFNETGLQFMEFNTLFQLLAAQLDGSPILDTAETMLLMPDLFHWLLTGEKANEQTDASTTQLYDPRTGTWATKLIEKFDLPKMIFGSIVPPGTRLGSVLPEVATETNLSGVDVVLPASHDTGSAVYAVPSSSGSSESRPNWCYLSSGTWSLMGAELAKPVINSQVAEWNFTNEGGVAGTTRLLTNCAGMWLVQECRRIWQRDGQELSWDDLVQQAATAEPLVAIINPNDPTLTAPDDMPAAISQLCQQSGQPVPQSRGAMIRCALESLAAAYRSIFLRLEQLVGGRIDTIHIVGGGSQNELLNQWTADACQRTVVAGPIEATAIGNILVQAQTAGVVSSHSEARELVRNSFPMKTFEPDASQADRWQAAAKRIGGTES